MSPEMSSRDTVRCLYSEQHLAQRVRALAEQISNDYAGKPLLMIGVLKGAWVFMADLVRCLTIPVRCDFVKLSSYGTGTTTTEDIQLQLDVSLSVADQDVLVVEDIVDTGTCALWLLDHLRRKGPSSIRLCTLLDKPARRVSPVPIDYIGFTIADHFVVGYGIDWSERYRELPYVGHILSGGGPS
jgi:hypoxanthine phosphoribosyltransferase